MRRLNNLFLATAFFASSVTVSFAADTSNYTLASTLLANSDLSPIVKSRLPHLHTKDIKVFLSKSHLIEEEKLDDMAYIVGLQEGVLIADAGKLIYGRKLEGKRGTIFDIIRPGEIYRDYETGESLGVHGRHVGTAELLGGEDPKTLRIKTSSIEVMRGDRLIPADTSSVVQAISHPRSARSKVSGHIIDIQDGVYEAGQYQIVAIDRGANDGLRAGDILAVNSTSERIVDIWGEPQEIKHTGEPVSPQVIYTPHDEFIANHDGQKGNIAGIIVDTTADIISLPEESAGHIMVYRTFDNVSYAIVANSVRSLAIGYPVHNP